MAQRFSNDKCGDADKLAAATVSRAALGYGFRVTAKGNPKTACVLFGTNLEDCGDHWDLYSNLTFVGNIWKDEADIEPVEEWRKRNKIGKYAEENQ